MQIIKMTDMKPGGRQQVAEIFVDAYYQELAPLEKNKDKLIRAFGHAFQEEVFFVALEEDQPIGILACSHDAQRALRLEASHLRKHLGFIKGSLAYSFMKKDFHKALSYPPGTGYIECVGTKKEARGKGAATQLMAHLLNTLPYESYVLEVIDTNQTARGLYEKLGFVEVERIPVKHPKRMGFKEKIYMKRSVENERSI